jgi:hypothetical protein
MANETLVKGYEIFNYSEDCEETKACLFCLTHDGRLFTTGYRKVTREVRDNFNVKGDVWTAVTEMPPQVSFIGNYLRPANLPR